MSVADDQRRFGLELASALCARLCHDFANPLGTVSATLELATDQPEHAEEALTIAVEAAAALVSRIRLLRAAWAGDCGSLDRVQLSEFASGLPSRVRTDLSGLAEMVFDGEVARILLNLLLLGAEALPGGGEVALAGALPSGITLSVAGPSIAWSASLGPTLLDPLGVPAEPRTVQAPLTACLAGAAGLRLSFLFSPAAGAAAAPLLLLAPV